MQIKYCPYCGTKLDNGAHFCKNCGNPIDYNTEKMQKEQCEENTSQRKYIYDGFIHKCPNCGEVLESFSANCPTCGMELRSTKVTNSVREFALKLEAIEAQREYEKSFVFLGLLSQMYRIPKTDEQIISLIKNYSVPNTKEDILEFMILATSNVDVSVYDTANKSAAAKAKTEAWIAKIKQVYAKARNTYGTDRGFSEIQDLYDSCYADIKKQKKKIFIRNSVLVGLILMMFSLLLIPAITSPSRKEAAEIKRLETIVLDVQEALEKKEYKFALNMADSIDYQLYDVAMERKWDIQREYWVDKVLEEAVKNGVSLEYTPTPDVDNANDELSGSESSEVQSASVAIKDMPDNANDIMNENNTEVSKEMLEEFTDGYKEVVFDDYNSPASENGLGNSKVYMYCTLDRTEIFESDGITAILGYVIDDSNNQWMIEMHFLPAVSKTAFNNYIGKEIVLRGVYNGFSEVKKMPVVVLDELLVLATGENATGMQKFLD